MPKAKKNNRSKSSEMTTKALIFILASLVSISLISFGSYSLGFNEGLRQTKNIVIENISDIETPENLGVQTSFSIFWEAWETLKNLHPDIDELSDSDLIYGAISGLTNSIGDPNTIFFTPDDSKKFDQDINGRFSGIGAEIGVRGGQLIIIAPLKDSPAERAGIMAKDKIVGIDGESTIGMNADEAAKKIRGEIDTPVVLTINREGVLNKFDISIIRDDIEIPTVDAQLLGKEENILYLQVYNFTANLPSLLYKTMIKGALRNPDAVILDLRNNPGGFLSVAVNFAGWFLEDGKVVVTERFASGSEEVFKANGNERLKDVPIVILINGGSASASEIIAGALRVHRNTALVGERTFGKGTVQKVERLSDDSVLKITIANWHLPDGSIIEGNGLEPNFVVEITEEDLLEGRDPQLDKALELIEAKI